MKLCAGVAAIVWLLMQIGAGAGQQETAFRYRREVELPGAAGVQSCAVLDARVYAHAEPALADLRLIRGEGTATAEIPYAFTVSETGFSSDAAPVLNLGTQGQTVSFNLQMPERLYSGVVLQLGGVNFLAEAKVSGLRSVRDADGTLLGTFTLFDLSRQRLGRNTTLALAESSFPFLHVELAYSAPVGEPRFVPTTALVEGALVPPSREAQTLYTTVAETKALKVRGRQSVAEFVLPAHVPVERVSFALSPKFAANFSRTVRITARAVEGTGGEAPANEELTGEIARVRLTEGTAVIRESSLSVPAILGSNVQRAAKVQVAVENEDDRPVGIDAVRLEMRQRRMCFDAPGGSVALYYGATGMKAPAYDFSRVFRPGETVALAKLGPEKENRGYVARVKVRTLLERHPELVWAGVIGVLVIIGGVAWGIRRR